MHLQPTLSLLLYSLTTLTTAKAKSSKANDAILLSNVRTLTLHSNKPTTNRRVPAIPQLKCIGGSAQPHYEIDVMRCKNSGSEYDAEDIQWTCQAELPPEFKLGSTEVVCEGYDGPEDRSVLKGSCGVEYRLVLTELGERKFGGGRRQRKKDALGDIMKGVDSKYGRKSSSFGERVWSFLFWLVFVGVLVTVVCKVFAPQNGTVNTRWRNPTNFFGGGGGGGFDDGGDPPPPYTPRSPPKSSSSGSSSGGPGFWSGTGLGGAMGYAAGNYMAGRNANREREMARERETERQSWFTGGPSTYGGGGGGSNVAGPSNSGARYESTGFGGTRRR